MLPSPFPHHNKLPSKAVGIQVIMQPVALSSLCITVTNQVMQSGLHPINPQPPLASFYSILGGGGNARLKKKYINEIYNSSFFCWCFNNKAGKIASFCLMFLAFNPQPHVRGKLSSANFALAITLRAIDMFWPYYNYNIFTINFFVSVIDLNCFIIYCLSVCPTTSITEWMELCLEISKWIGLNELNKW